MPENPKPSPARKPRRTVTNDGLPLRWIIAGVVALHLAVFALLTLNSEKIIGATTKKEPQNFYFAEEVFEVEAQEGEGQELVRVREFTVSTELYEEDASETIQPDTGPLLKNGAGADLPTASTRQEEISLPPLPRPAPDSSSSPQQ